MTDWVWATRDLRHIRGIYEILNMILMRGTSWCAQIFPATQVRTRFTYTVQFTEISWKRSDSWWKSSCSLMVIEGCACFHEKMEESPIQRLFLICHVLLWVHLEIYFTCRRNGQFISWCCVCACVSCVCVWCVLCEWVLCKERPEVVLNVLEWMQAITCSNENGVVKPSDLHTQESWALLCLS